MIETILEIGKNYGLAGVAIIGVLWLLYLFYKLERQMFKHEEESKDISATCIARKEYFTNTFDRLETLEKKDAGDDGRFNKIDVQLKSIGDNVTKIVDHFVTKGMH